MDTLKVVASVKINDMTVKYLTSKQSGWKKDFLE